MIKSGITIYVYGRVQGVGFRYQTFRWAKFNRLTGYVCNLHDGSVKIVAYGDSEQLNKLTHWLEQGGPPGARIDNLSFHTCAVEDVADFSVRH
ncbi:acylphosphatase [Photorhabdus luminescens]|uniref:Acylphosphatase n=1 Tax=Photorhabdus akhurstii TaxID=171438 RepID=A0ABX8LSN0_9GAMM|nr:MULTISPECIES: acylphosphatase [Photorhabdus]KGM29076.1 acylphosphatase [Photorhabdus luminescens]MBS9426765.1 acylphosphatase [Photorhabdus akhurstii]MBS9431127.1 acylphosphatase [Photorhabdus hainanensis]MCC8456196.1 acylphosphatase [Photorhabdus aegyptia]PQQ32796.1 acylphosphatase [Photorhabdus luminescens]